MLDPKPLGALVEYTLKPILEEANDLLDRMEKAGIAPKKSLVMASCLYVLHSTLNLIRDITVVSIICYTCLHIIR